jgi:hypothetical protein
VEIADLPPAFLHGRELVATATLRTSREGVLVRTGTGIAEVVADDVAVLDERRVSRTFGESEIELIAGEAPGRYWLVDSEKPDEARAQNEVDEVAWLTGAEAERRPTYERDQEVLRSALARLG